MYLLQKLLEPLSNHFFLLKPHQYLPSQSSFTWNKPLISQFLFPPIYYIEQTLPISPGSLQGGERIHYQLRRTHSLHKLYKQGHLTLQSHLFALSVFCSLHSSTSSLKTTALVFVLSWSTGYSRVYPMRLPKNAYFVYRTTTCHKLHLCERIGRRRLSHRSFSC
ncbi:hypothetical protein GBA52_009833 [Prunus armeniaca]|nr:hypothetical protein GBA52_009833 [Prunus armeniaca]